MRAVSADLPSGVPLNRAQLQQAHDLCDRVLRGAVVPASVKGGALVFIAGGTDRDRTAFLRRLRDTFVAADAIAVAGSYASGEYADWNKAPAQSRFPIEEVVSVVAALTGLVQPIVGAVVAASPAALKVARLWRDEPEAAPNDPDRAFWELLAAVVDDGPAVCLIADFDRAGETFRQLSAYAAAIAERLPLAVLLTLEADRGLPEQQPAEDAVLYVPWELCVDRELAEWWPLQLPTRDDVEDWLGSADPWVIDELERVAARRSNETAEVFAEWVRMGLVERTDGRWTRAAAAGNPDRMIPSRMLEDRINGLIGDATPTERRRARDLIACASLEGATFTAAAVAIALERQIDDVVDFLDDYLVQDESRAEGLIEEDAPFTVTRAGGKGDTLWVYRFTSELWRENATQYLSAKEAARMSAALGHALMELYGQQPVAARKAALLFARADDADLARTCQRIADFAASAETMQRRARWLVQADKSSWDGARRRNAREELRYFGEHLRDVLQLRESLEIFDSLYELASQPASQSEERRSYALSRGAEILSALGRVHEAEERARAGVAIARSSGLRAREAKALSALADILSLTDRDRARRAIRRAAELSPGDQMYRMRLVEFDRDAFTTDEVRIVYTDALRVGRETREIEVQSTALVGLGSLDRSEQRYTSAREHFEAALAIAEFHHKGHASMNARRELAQLAAEEGRFDDASHILETFVDDAVRRGDRVMVLQGRLVAAGITRRKIDHSLANGRISPAAAEAAHRELQTQIESLRRDFPRPRPGA